MVRVTKPLFALANWYVVVWILDDGIVWEKLKFGRYFIEAVSEHVVGLEARDSEELMIVCDGDISVALIFIRDCLEMNKLYSIVFVDI